MTIAVGVACPEGLVVAADSRSSVQLKTGHRVATDYASKVFDVAGNFVVATFGWAILEGKTISGHVRDFNMQTTIPNDIGQAAELLRDHFQQRLNAHIAAGYDPAPPSGIEPLGFIVAGYDPSGVGHMMRVYPYGGGLQAMCQTNNPGAVWNGEIDVLARLLKGYDGIRIDVSRWAKRNRDALEGAEYLSNYGWFALQDAVDWSVFAVRTTIDTQRFTNGTVGSPGAAVTCGGAVTVATVTWGDGVTWIQRSEPTA